MELVAEVTDEPQEEVQRRLRKEHQRLGSNVWEEMQRWGIEPYVWSDKLVEFYSKTDAFLYESLVWNRTAKKNQMRKWIGEFLARDFAGPAKILTYGDGLGFDSLYLTKAGHDVTSFEVSEKCVKLAKSVFARAGETLRILGSPEEVEEEAYDVVVCLDVLEHVPDPPGLVGQLAGALRRGGRLIVHAPFFYVAWNVVTHLRANKKYSGDLVRLYTPHGLTPIDGQFFWDPLVLEKCDRNAGPRNRFAGREVLLRWSGLLLSVGRFWPLPHIWVAKLLSKVEKEYKHELWIEE